MEFYIEEELLPGRQGDAPLMIRRPVLNYNVIQEPEFDRVLIKRSLLAARIEVTAEEIEDAIGNVHARIRLLRENLVEMRVWEPMEHDSNAGYSVQEVIVFFILHLYYIIDEDVAYALVYCMSRLNTRAGIKKQFDKVRRKNFPFTRR